VAIAGVGFSGVDRRGLHFGAVTYGHATFVDALGRRTAVSAAFRRGEIALEVPAGVLDAAQYPAVLDPTISAELPADDPVPSAAPGAQTTPAMDFDGTNFFVTWVDFTGGGLFGTRVTPAGVSLEHGGIKLASPGGLPGIAFDGTNHLLVWEDSRNQPSGYQRDIYGSHVSPAGVMLDTSNLQLGHSPGDETAPKVACGGGVCAVVWQNTTAGNNNSIVAGVLNGPNTLTGIAVNTGTTAFAPAVAFDGTNFLVVWEDHRNSNNRDVYGARLTPAGVVLDNPNLAVTTTNAFEDNPEVAFDGTNYLVVWGGVSSAVQGVRVSRAGAVLDASPIAIDPSGNDSSKGVDFDGTNFVVSFLAQSANRDMRAVRVTSAGAVLDAAPLQVSTAASTQTATVAASSGGTSLIAWEDSRGDIYGARVSPAGALPDPNGLLLSEQPNSQTGGAAAYDGTNWFVVWSDTRDGGPSHIFGARFDSTGTILDNPSLPITTGSRWQVAPRVAFDGTQYLVVYSDQPGSMNDSDILGTRVTPAGNVLDPSGFVICNATNYQQGPDVAAADGGFGVVWEDFRNGTRRAYGARVAPDHTVLDPAGVSLATTSPSHHPRIASDGTGFAVAWEDERNSATKYDDIYAGHWAIDGTLLDGAGVPIASTTGYDDVPGIAYGGGHYVIAWRGYGASDYDEFTRTFEADAGMSTTLSLSTAPHDQIGVAVAFDGQNFVAGWQDWRNLTNPNLSAFGDIYGSRISPSGIPLDPAGIAISVTPVIIESAPSIAKGPGRRLLIVYNRDGVTGAFTRVRVRVATFNDPPVAQAQSVSLKQDTLLAINLTATDVDSDPLTYSVVAMPTNGMLSGSPPAVTYTPNAGYLGPDSFTFKANDGTADSNVAAVTITVNPLNTAPVAMAQSATTNEDTAKPITLVATDVDGDPLTYSIVAQPMKGILSGTPPNVTYTPNANFNGSDSFTFKANDGKVDSNVATVSLTILAVNDPPVATPKTVTTPQDTAVMITLTGTDVEGDMLTYSVVTNPSHGMLTGTPPTLTYTPTAGYRGPDSFTFVANDGQANSAPATVSITVSAVNHAPTPLPQSVMVQQGHSVGITLMGTDPDGDTLTFTILNPPLDGNLTGTPPNMTYTPPDAFRGMTSFSFQVSDAQLTSGSAAVTITVTNAPPTVMATAMPTTAMTGDTVTFTAVGSDPGKDPLTYSWDFGDGSSAGMSASVMHAFSTAGTYAVKVTCTDGVDSAMATAQVVITGTSLIPDAGAPDAGALADGGETQPPDAGSQADAGNGTMTATGGCGCGSAGFAPGLLALSALLRRRRLPRSAPLR
jgi:hypothetical protein